MERDIETYRLAGIGEELEARWTAERSDRSSLRELADLFNRRLLERVMRDADLIPLEGEVENLYRLLTADSVGGGRRVGARRRLERSGIDVDTLEADFVSHQAIHTYLTDRRGAAYSNDGPALEGEARKLTRLQQRVTAVAEDTVGRLAARGDLVIGDFDVLVDVNVLCRGCGSSFPVDSLLDQGGCQCPRD